jgi:hypothetical protein
VPGWYDQVGGLFLDGDKGGIGTNLGDAIWWTLMSVALGALPLGVLGAAAGPRRRARGPASTPTLVQPWADPRTSTSGCSSATDTPDQMTCGRRPSGTPVRIERIDN